MPPEIACNSQCQRVLFPGCIAKTFLCIRFIFCFVSWAPEEGGPTIMSFFPGRSLLALLSTSLHEENFHTLYFDSAPTLCPAHFGTHCCLDVSSKLTLHFVAYNKFWYTSKSHLKIYLTLLCGVILENATRGNMKMPYYWN